MTNLILDQGATWRRVWRYTDSLGDPLPVLFARLQIRLGSAEGRAIFDLDSGDKGGLIIDALTGRISVEVTSAASSAINIFSADQGTTTELGATVSGNRTASGALCAFGLEVDLAGGDTKRVDQGVIILTREVVHD